MGFISDPPNQESLSVKPKKLYFFRRFPDDYKAKLEKYCKNTLLCSLPYSGDGD